MGEEREKLLPMFCGKRALLSFFFGLSEVTERFRDMRTAIVGRQDTLIFAGGEFVFFLAEVSFTEVILRRARKRVIRILINEAGEGENGFRIVLGFEQHHPFAILLNRVVGDEAGFRIGRGRFGSDGNTAEIGRMSVDALRLRSLVREQVFDAGSGRFELVVERAHFRFDSFELAGHRRKRILQLFLLSGEAFDFLGVRFLRDCGLLMRRSSAGAQEGKRSSQPISPTKFRRHENGHIKVKIKASEEFGKVSRSIFKTIRVRKEDAAFVYFILESYEGIVSYSTLAPKPGEEGAAHRDLELRIPPDFEADVADVLSRLGDLVYELAPSEKRTK